MWRNDARSVADIIADAPDAIVLSPGPCTPREAGICLDLIHAASATIPIFGVCLGHQSLGEAFGGEVVRAPSPVHGKIAAYDTMARRVSRHQRRLRRDPIPFPRRRPRAGPLDLVVTAETDDGLIMGLSHRARPSYGVQFHPESIASEHGKTILKNFLDLATRWNGTQRKAA